jgi:hypothetical protein
MIIAFLKNCFCHEDLPRLHITKPELGELGYSFATEEAELDLSDGLEIECTAPYPVEWVLGKYDFMKVPQKLLSRNGNCDLQL